MELVGAARLAFLPELLGGEPVVLTGHLTDLGALARLAEGGQPPARDATARRHVQSCARCADALDAMERARRLLSGLTVVAMPDADREQMIGRVEARVRHSLPAAAPVEEESWEDELRRPYSITLIGLGLVVAMAVGTGAGVAASRGSGSGGAAAVANRAPVTAPPALVVRVPLPPSPTPPPTVLPTPRTFLVTPSPTPTPTLAPTVGPTDGTATPLPGAPTVALDPSAGPNNTQITVTGAGWTPNAFINLAYLPNVGVGATSTAQADAAGSFTAQLAAHDPSGLPGAHDITVQDGTSTVTVTFTAT
jgi:hypothetical protein